MLENVCTFVPVAKAQSPVVRHGGGVYFVVVIVVQSLSHIRLFAHGL